MQKSWGNFFANTEFRWHLITWSAFYALQTLRRCLLLWKCLFHFPDATPTPTHSAHFPGHITTDMTTLLAKWIVHNLTSRNFNCSCDRIKFYLKFPTRVGISLVLAETYFSACRTRKCYANHNSTTAEMEMYLLKLILAKAESFPVKEICLFLLIFGFPVQCVL